jgi:hypothetical protein
MEGILPDNYLRIIIGHSFHFALIMIMKGLIICTYMSSVYIYNLRCLSLQYFAIFYMYLHGLYSVLNEQTPKSLCNKPVRTILIADALG